mgnify:CR=1 FL=1
MTGFIVTSYVGEYSPDAELIHNPGEIELMLEIPLPKISVTILDGPFTSMVSMGSDNMFTLSHIQHSVLATATPEDGLPPVWTNTASNRENLLLHGARYLPILREARYVGSRYGTRTVHALPEDVAQRLDDWLRRRLAGEPIAYITGFKAFFWSEPSGRRACARPPPRHRNPG